MDAEYVKQYNCTLLSGYVFTNIKPESVTKHFFESDVDAIIDPALKQLTNTQNCHRLVLLSFLEKCHRIHEKYLNA